MIKISLKSISKFFFLIIIYLPYQGILLALGALLCWHSMIITRGETTIENLSNKDERRRCQSEQKIFVNPYDYGRKENWRLFLGITEER